MLTHMILTVTFMCSVQKLLCEGVTANMVKATVSLLCCAGPGVLSCIDFVQAMDQDGDGEVDRSEFLAYMLVKLKKVDPEALDALNTLFDDFDTDSDGRLTTDDVHRTARKSKFLDGDDPVMAVS